jgi:hypothetical protein
MCILLLIVVQQGAARRNPAHHLRAVCQRRLGMEGPGFAGHALGDDFGVFVN